VLYNGDIAFFFGAMASGRSGLQLWAVAGVKRRLLFNVAKKGRDGEKSERQFGVKPYGYS
jgi:hypothetical protein